MKIFRYWAEFFSFLKSPDYLNLPSSFNEKIWLSINIFILKILFALLFVLLVIVIPGYTPHALIQQEEILKTSITVAIFAGVFEELVYRLPLTKFNPFYVAFSLSGLVFIAIKKIWFHTMLLQAEGILPSLSIALISFPVFYLFIRRNGHALNRFWEKNFPFIFYLSAVLFALSHFFNGKELELVNLKANITQLMTALCLGFLRIRSGLIFGIIIHIIWDLIL